MSANNSASSSANVPAFLTKLWKLVEDPNYDHLIHWAQNGKSFIIRNQAQFAKELLPLYFKHNNMASFIRQLNMYGFRKLTNIENSGLRSERDDIEFYHHHFVKNQESSLEFIKRKIKAPLQVSCSKVLDENRIRTDDVGSLLLDVKAIKGKQESVDSLLESMQKENETLWREIAKLRLKHQKQQHIVDKLIHFLMSMFHRRRIEVKKRKSPLMIGLNDGDDTNGAKRLAKSTGIQNHSAGPLIFDVSDDIIDSELGESTVNYPIINAVDLSPYGITTDGSPASNLALSLTSASIDPTADVESLLPPLESTINSDEIVSPTTLNQADKPQPPTIDLKAEKVSTTEQKNTEQAIVTSSQVSLNGLSATSGIKLAPSTSNGSIILTQIIPSSALEGSINAVSSQIDLGNPDQSLESALDSPIPGQPLNCTTPEPVLNTPAVSYIPNLGKSTLYDDESTSVSDSRPVSVTTVTKDIPKGNIADNYTIENFADHISNIDSELSWLQEQLAESIGDEEGLNFDVNSLMDLDLTASQ